jgi:hypothetical protein
MGQRDLSRRVALRSGYIDENAVSFQGNFAAIFGADVCGRCVGVVAVPPFPEAWRDQGVQEIASRSRVPAPTFRLSF